MVESIPPLSNTKHFIGFSPLQHILVLFYQGKGKKQVKFAFLYSLLP
ncbi:hypothetical protein HMPREF1040_0516 [Megasphaera sp. UPII 135-E]|nr:hypothetical protein HMPREF1040_0516 [Megasphaera sp. UPII 135-E]